MTISIDGMRLLLADCQAFAAQDAQLGEELNLGLALETFRVMAPEAAQRAAAQEDCSADTGTIVDRETLNIENKTSLIRHPQILPWMGKNKAIYRPYGLE